MSNYFPEQVEPVDIIGWLMDKILQSVVETFALNGVELPELQYLTIGVPVHDCEQVTVTNIQAYVGPPGDQAGGPQPCDGPRTGVFQVEIVRCFVDGSNTNLRQGASTAPDPVVINEYTKSRMKDEWLLLDSARVLPDYNAVIADVSAGDPQGKYQGIVMNLVVQL